MCIQSENKMNLDITWSLTAWAYWLRLTILEIDLDVLWGFSFGILRIALNRDDGAEFERSLLFINKTKYLTRIDIGFIRLYNKFN